MSTGPNQRNPYPPPERGDEPPVEIFDDSEASDEETVNSTLTELALMLVFVFALIAVAAVSTESSTPTAASVVDQTNGTSATSCLYQAAAGSGARDGDYVKVTENAQGSAVFENVKLDEDRSAPVRQSLFEVRWLGVSDATDLDPLTSYEVRLLPGNGTRGGGAPPFLYLNLEARVATIQVLDMLGIEVRTPKWVEPATSMRTGRYGIGDDTVGTGDKAYQFSEWLIDINEATMNEFNCVFFVDLVDYPSEQWVANRETARGINTSGAFRDGIRRIYLEPSDENNFVNFVSEPSI